MKKLKKTILKYLKAGLSYSQVSWAMTLGVTLGLFPIYGLSSFMCLGLAWATRLNAPIMLAATYSMSFVKPLLIIPFLKLGEWLFQAEPMRIGLAALMQRFAESPWATLAEFGWSFVHALSGWLVVIPLLLPVLYRICSILVTPLAIPVLKKHTPRDKPYVCDAMFFARIRPTNGPPPPAQRAATTEPGGAISPPNGVPLS